MYTYLERLDSIYGIVKQWELDTQVCIIKVKKTYPNGSKGSPPNIFTISAQVLQLWMEIEAVNFLKNPASQAGI